MPDDRGGVEADPPAAVEDTPAQVDVVARGLVRGVESPDLGQHQLPEGHVAPGYVLGPVVAGEHVHRSPWGPRHDVRAWRVVGRR